MLPAASTASAVVDRQCRSPGRSQIRRCSCCRSHALWKHKHPGRAPAPRRCGQGHLRYSSGYDAKPVVVLLRSRLQSRLDGKFPWLLLQWRSRKAENATCAVAPSRLAQLKPERLVQPKVRKAFPDTAFWAADLVTDKAGHARAKVEFPDSLTTWRATARGITPDTEVGSSTLKTIVRKNLIVRLAVPRFFVRGDEVL